jgi:hypothetical protein
MIRIVKESKGQECEPEEHGCKANILPKVMGGKFIEKVGDEKKAKKAQKLMGMEDFYIAKPEALSKNKGHETIDNRCGSLMGKNLLMDGNDELLAVDINEHKMEEIQPKCKKSKKGDSFPG